MSNQALEPALGVGYGVRREDDTFSLASPSLQVMTAPWGGADEWWELVRARITLPAATQCAVCGMGQLLGQVEVTVATPEREGRKGRERIFEVAFTGHAHGLTGAGAGDMLLVRDVTLQKNRVNELYDTLQQYESLCESIEDVYYRTDLSGIIAFISPSSYKLLAYEPEELLGRSLVDLCIDPEYWTELLEILARTDRVSDFDLVLQCKKGNQIPASLNAQVLLDKNGRRVAIEGILRDVTEREHLDNILAERTRKLQETMAELEHQKFALDQHAIVTVTDSDGAILYANKRMMATSQFSLAELKGHTHRLLNSGYHPKSFFEEMWRTIGNGRVWHGEMRNRKKDGGFYWVDCTIVPFMTPSGKPYQYVAISTEITERINAEKRLERNRSFLLSITDALGEGVYVLDLQGRLTFLNREAERLLGWREEELLGRNLHDAIHNRKPDGTPVSAEECPVHRSLLGRSFRVDEDHFIRKDGAMFPVSYVTAPLHQDGEITGSVAVFQDVTVRKKAEDELKRVRDMALEASRLKSEFLANMSHEIRTPMNAVIGMTDLLMDTPLNEEQYEFAEIVRDSSQSLLGIINDILDFSKIEAGKIDLEVIDFNPLTVVEGAAELLASQAQEKGLSLMTYVSPRIPVTLKGDPGRLRQMLVNLIGNAIKFTEEGEVVVRVREVEENATRLRVHFSVTDTGIGLSSKARERLFKPFTQADGATTRKFGGTGLGLAISKRLVELMGGDIGADSNEGEGSTFWFEVPLLRSDLQSADERGELQDVTVLRGQRILAVLENPADLEILSAYFSAWNMSCDGVLGGEAAVAAIRQASSAGQPFDLVLVSLSLSDQDPLELPLVLGHGAPLVALLDADDKESEESALEAGYARTLSKPVRQSELIDLLVDLVDPEAVRSRRPEPIESLDQRENGEPAPDAYDALESGKLLLLAEDNLVNQKVALMQLKKLGYAVHAVGNGKEAVEAISHLPYALILMDCQMPVMDGFEATHAIRKLETSSSRHIPIIALTANAMKGDRERCLKAGMDDYLSKPVTPEELKKKLEYWIPKSSGELPPIEINQLRQLFGADDEVIRELLQHFLPSARELLGKLRTAIEEQDGSRVVELSHELKGACANMGASGMAQVARRVERTGAADWGETRLSMDALERSFGRVEAFVEGF